MQGPRITLTRSDYVSEDTEICFIMKWLEKSEITEKLLIELLGYGELMGLGQFRNGSFGRFKVK